MTSAKEARGKNRVKERTEAHHDARHIRVSRGARSVIGGVGAHARDRRCYLIGGGDRERSRPDISRPAVTGFYVRELRALHESLGAAWMQF